MNGYDKAMSNRAARNSRDSLRRMALALQADARRLMDLSDRIDAELLPAQEEGTAPFAGSYLHANVTDAVTSALNTSGYIAAAQSAISAAHEASMPLPEGATI